MREQERGREIIIFLYIIGTQLSGILDSDWSAAVLHSQLFLYKDVQLTKVTFLFTKGNHFRYIQYLCPFVWYMAMQ